MDKLDMTPKEMILNLITEEKEKFGEYSQLCAQYQIKPDPLAMARHLGILETLQALLMERIITKT
jgi:hypothetical protein